MAQIIDWTPLSNGEPDCIAESAENFDTCCMDILVYLQGFKDRFCFSVRVQHREMVKAPDAYELTMDRVRYARLVVLNDWKKAGRPQP